LSFSIVLKLSAPLQYTIDREGKFSGQRFSRRKRLADHQADSGISWMVKNMILMGGAISRIFAAVQTRSFPAYSDQESQRQGKVPQPCEPPPYHFGLRRTPRMNSFVGKIAFSRPCDNFVVITIGIRVGIAP